MLLFAFLASTTAWSYSVPEKASEGQLVSEADTFKDVPAKSLTIEHQGVSEGSQINSEEQILSLVWFTSTVNFSEKTTRKDTPVGYFSRAQDLRRLLSLQIFPFHFFW
ncbi:MAG: hypothetical protein CL605_01620 [Altibacter sp.]|nr:hypothetical protein [Altibacter sp.]